MYYWDFGSMSPKKRGYLKIGTLSYLSIHGYFGGLWLLGGRRRTNSALPARSFFFAVTSSGLELFRSLKSNTYVFQVEDLLFETIRYPAWLTTHLRWTIVALYPGSPL
jgi:hypothetical protein